MFGFEHQEGERPNPFISTDPDEVIVSKIPWDDYYPIDTGDPDSEVRWSPLLGQDKG